MARGAVALQHAVAVAKHFDAIVAVKAAAFGIGDAFVGLQRRLFSAGSQFDSFVRGNFRRVEQVQIGRIKGQQFFICHARTRVRRSVTCNVQRGLHGACNRLRA